MFQKCWLGRFEALQGSTRIMVDDRAPSGSDSWESKVDGLSWNMGLGGLRGDAIGQYSVSMKYSDRDTCSWSPYMHELLRLLRCKLDPLPKVPLAHFPANITVHLCMASLLDTPISSVCRATL
jgi:hypothetical protein